MGEREEHRYFDKEFKYEAIRLMIKLGNILFEAIRERLFYLI